MSKPLYHITAKSLDTGKTLDLQYPSIDEAKVCNPTLKDFRLEGVVKDGVFK